MIAAWPYWERLRRMRRVRRAIMGANAGVVGILAAALWDPVITHGIGSVTAGLMAAAGFGALLTGRVPPWALVAASAGLGALLL